jgi:hypothetical protein
MVRGKAFIEVLDEVLAGYEPDRPATPPRMAPGLATPSIFCFEPRDIKRGAAPAPWLSAPVAAAAAPPPPPPGHGRVRRALSPRHREAFDAFVQFGGPLDDDFTLTELRTMFRSLALQYHPDRHPGSSASERAHLSVRFAQLRAAYESLKSVPVCSN